MKLAKRLMIVSVASLLSVAAAAAPSSYKVDPVHSSVAFRVKHNNANHVYGTFSAPTGKVELTDEGGSLEVSVAVQTVSSGNGKRDEHLKSNDYFAAGQNPTISFKSSKLSKSADGTYSATGQLTLRGVSKEITIPVTLTEEVQGMRGGTVRGLETTFSINRSDFGMKEGIPAVSDEVTLLVSLQLAK